MYKASRVSGFLPFFVSQPAYADMGCACKLAYGEQLSAREYECLMCVCVCVCVSCSESTTKRCVALGLVDQSDGGSNAGLRVAKGQQAEREGSRRVGQAAVGRPEQFWLGWVRAASGKLPMRDPGSQPTSCSVPLAAHSARDPASSSPRSGVPFAGRRYASHQRQELAGSAVYQCTVLLGAQQASRTVSAMLALSHHSHQRQELQAHSPVPPHLHLVRTAIRHGAPISHGRLAITHLVERAQRSSTVCKWGAILSIRLLCLHV